MFVNSSLRVQSGLLVSILCWVALCTQASAEGLSSPAPADAEVYFIEPVAGASVPETFVVKFGLRGMGVAPAGVDLENTGHHHLLINAPDIDPSLPLPSSEQVRHFGKGQTETLVTLPPGEHLLQLVLGNHLHVPHTPPVTSEVIRVQVRVDSK
ncbi:MAG: DUF4399 domain-containing protein [Pseudomonadales bacterium]